MPVCSGAVMLRAQFGTGPSCPCALEPSCSEHSLEPCRHARVLWSRHAPSTVSGPSCPLAIMPKWSRAVMLTTHFVIAFEDVLPMEARKCSSHPRSGPHIG